MKSITIKKNDSGNYDLEMLNGAFAFCEAGEQAARHCDQRLMIFKTEQTLNNMLTEKSELGTQWYDKIFKADISTAEKDFHIRERILKTPGIKKLINFYWEQSAHTLKITARILTNDGEADYNTILGL